MHLLVVASVTLFLFLFFFLPWSAATDTILAGQALGVDDKLVSKNGRYALGFFNTSRNSSQKTTSWYLGIWFNTVPEFTSVWVANRDEPIKNTTSFELTISHDGNLVVLNQSTKSVIWSSHVNTTRNNTSAMLLSSGNLILTSSLNSSEVLWQSFDHPTDTQLPGQKFGWDKVTGLNRRLVSAKNLNNPATGAYCGEFDPSGVNQYLLTPLNPYMPYWISGVWNGQTFPSVSQSTTPTTSSNSSFVDDDRQKYFVYYIDERVIFRHVLGVSGQTKGLIWTESKWVLYYSQPKAQCDVYAVCGPFAICNDDASQSCDCMEGFSVASPEDWDLQDRTGGCSRDTPLDCASNKSSTPAAGDKFHPVACISLPQKAEREEAAISSSECEQACLSNCSCTAYSFGDGGCSIWHNELLNVRQLQCGDATNSNGGSLYLRLSAKDTQSLKNNRRKVVIAAAIGACFAALGLSVLILLLMIWRNKRKSSGRILNGPQGYNGIIAFRYDDLQRATKRFTEKLGAGSFGSVFKGFIDDSIAIAVKRLDGAYQGEKQFRAEVSSIGAIQHINLVKLVGFCCEGSNRLLVYEHMSNSSLDVHLFRGNPVVLNWDVRYQISLGVARGLAYLHESCRECIIHCDIKPENILLDASFVPKIADFGMAKLLGRDFSRVLTTMRGTAGYLAPEWLAGVPITPKVDVYSYGMVLLELLSGKRNSTSTPVSSAGDFNVFFPVHAAHKLLEGDVKSLLDHTLRGDVNLDEAELLCKVACWCIQDELDRPTMAEVVQILEGLVEITMPPVPRLLQAMAGNSL